MMHAGHIPVMLQEVLVAMAPVDGEHYVDGTFGGGGYTAALLSGAECRVTAIDRDPDAEQRAATVAQDFPGRFTFVAGAFGSMDALLGEGVSVDAVVLDIGVSSFQLDQAERGFSFVGDGPLDMRMGQSGETAADVVNTYSEDRLADIFYHYGEERKARKLAAAIVNDRRQSPFETTRSLASLAERVVGFARRGDGRRAVHPATRAFQALRIQVNDELGELERGLKAAENLLAEGGRLIVVTFHSLEDRIVKNFMAARAGRSSGGGSRHLPAHVNTRSPSFELPKGHLVKPGKAEIDANPRSRSAKLRWAVRTASPAFEGRAV